MTITHRVGSIFDSGAEALVNPVDCTGVQGKGLALEFRNRYPAAATAYRAFCDRSNPKAGNIWGLLGTPIIYFAATKQHWREPGHISYVKTCLDELVWQVEFRGVTSIAIPAMGCGLGGLAWDDVRPLIEAAGHRMRSEVMIYGPR